MLKEGPYVVCRSLVPPKCRLLPGGLSSPHPWPAPLLLETDTAFAQCDLLKKQIYHLIPKVKVHSVAFQHSIRYRPLCNIVKSPKCSGPSSFLSYFFLLT